MPILRRSSNDTEEAEQAVASDLEAMSAELDDGTSDDWDGAAGDLEGFADGEGLAGGYGLTSPRLERLAAYFASQMQLVEDTGAQVEHEVEPWRALLGRQAETTARIMGNLDVRLGPIREYAQQEEASLRALEEKIAGEGMDFVAHSFSELVQAQSDRVNETRELIDRQQEPFDRFRDDERQTVELALERFDREIEALEQALADQAAVLTRLLESMRGEEFRQVAGYLAARQRVLDEVANEEVTDPSAIASRLSRVVDDFQVGRADEGFGAVWGATAATDEALMLAGTRSATGAGGEQPTPSLLDDVEVPDEDELLDEGDLGEADPDAVDEEEAALVGGAVGGESDLA
jgi:hypothetical protein